MKQMTVLVAFLMVFALGGCDSRPGGKSDHQTGASGKSATSAEADHEGDEDHEHAGEHAEGGHHHQHVAPHGGALIVLEDETANAELVLDAATGKLTCYLFDAHVTNAVRVKQPTIEFTLIVPASDGASAAADQSVFTIELQAVANPLTGETVGDTSEFSIASPTLKGVKSFEGVITSVAMRGGEYKDVRFKFPK